MNFRIDDEGIDDATHVLELRGEMELHTAPEFKERVVELIAAGKKHIIVDISGATLGYDDGGLGVLVGAVKRLLPDDGSLALVCPDEGMMKVFEITGLHRVCRSYPSRAEALQALGGSPQRIQREAPEDVAQREAAEVEAARARRDAKQAADARARRKAETASALRREAEEWWDQLESDPPSGASLTVDQLRDLIRLHGWSVHWDVGVDYPMDACRALLLDDDGRIVASVGGWYIDQDDRLPYWEGLTPHGPGTWEERRHARRLNPAEVLAELFRQATVAERERLARPWWRRASKTHHHWSD